MEYTQNLPRIDTLYQLTKHLGPFPDNAYHIADKARHLGYSQEIVAFIRLFDPMHVFSSRREFLTDCEELEIIMGEVQREIPHESVLSAQD